MATEEDFYGRLAARVRAQMVIMGISQEQVAAHLQIHQASVSRKLTGTRKISALEAVRLAHLLEIPLVDLLGPIEEVKHG